MLILKIEDWFWTEQWSHVYHQCDAGTSSTVRQYNVLSNPVCTGCLKEMSESVYLKLRRKYKFVVK